MLGDKRYTYDLEYTGHPSMEPQYVVRFDDEFIGAANSMQEAQAISSLHAADRKFDLVTRVDVGEPIPPVLWLRRGKTHRVAYGANILDTDVSNAAEVSAQRFSWQTLSAARVAGLLED